MINNGSLSRHFFAAVALMILVLIFIQGAFAATNACTPRQEKTRIIYVNGVWNPSPADARDSAINLQNALSNGGLTGVKVETFWNPGDGNFNDAMEAAVAQNWGAPILSFVNLVANTISPVLGAILQNERDQGTARQRLYIDELKAQLRSGLAQEQKIVLVAHSQGNLLVNTVLREMNNEGTAIDSIGVVGVASPDTADAPTGALQITTSNDRVINAVPGHISTNFVVEPTVPSASDHRFVEGYLTPDIKNSNGSSIRDTIVSAVKQVKDSVEYCGLNLTIAPPSVTLKVGETFQFTVIAENPGRNNAAGIAPKVTWITDAPSIIGIGSTGVAGSAATGNIIGIAPGTFTVTVKDEVTKKTIKANVTVESTTPTPVTGGESAFRQISYTPTECKVGTFQYITNGQRAFLRQDFATVYESLCRGYSFPTGSIYIGPGHTRLEHAFGCEGLPNVTFDRGSGLSFALAYPSSMSTSNLVFSGATSSTDTSDSGVYSATGTFFDRDLNAPSDTPPGPVSFSASGTWTSGPVPAFAKCLAPRTPQSPNLPRFCPSISSGANDTWGCDYRNPRDPPRPGDWEQ